MKPKFIPILILVLAINFSPNLLFSQQPGVSINTNNLEPHPSAMLDVSSQSKGILIPRLSLDSSDDKLTITNAANALLVFNVKASMKDGDGKGFYYNATNAANPFWTKLIEKKDIPNAWLVSGNANITNADFLGTTTNKDVVFKCNDNEAFRIRGSAMLFTGDEEDGVTPLNGSFWNHENIGKGSFAVGFNTTASGNYSFAAGHSNTAGNNNIDASYAVALGKSTSATNMAAMSTGSNTIASGINAASFNAETEAEGNNSAAFNFGAHAEGANSAAFNKDTHAEGANSFVIGNLNTVIGENGFAQGNDTRSVGKNSAVFGVGNVANARHSFVVGTYNDALPFPFPNQGEGGSAYTDRIFEIGGGSSSNFQDRFNAMTVLRSGATAIGSANPRAMLDITKAPNNDGKALMRLTGSNKNGYYEMDVSSEGNKSFLDFSSNFPFNGGGYRFLNNNVNFELMRIHPNGQVDMIGELNVLNKIFSNGVEVTSDIRLKTDIKPIENVLGKINNIQPITYYFKDKKTHSSDHQIGFSAQEIQKEFPELVSTNSSTGYLGVNYAQMTPVLLQAIKEQQQQIDNQKQTSKEQQEIIDNLKSALQKEKDRNEVSEQKIKEHDALIKKLYLLKK